MKNNLTIRILLIFAGLAAGLICFSNTDTMAVSQAHNLQTTHVVTYDTLPHPDAKDSAIVHMYVNGVLSVAQVILKNNPVASSILNNPITNWSLAAIILSIIGWRWKRKKKTMQGPPQEK
jgi:hypothetical protein